MWNKMIEYRFEKACKKDINKINKMYLEAKKDMSKANYIQWENKKNAYPSKIDIINDLNLNSIYVVKDNKNKILGATTVYDTFESDYESIDGAWLTTDKKYLSLHRFVVKRKYQKRSVATFILSSVYFMAKEKGINSIKVDTHPKNSKMINLLLKNDYTNCGIIKISRLLIEPERIAFEKIVE